MLLFGDRIINKIHGLVIIKSKELIMNNKTFDNDSFKNIKDNIVSFYNLHKEQCDTLYNDSNDYQKLNIYNDINDLNYINTLFLKTSVVILTANKYEKNILHLNAVKAKKQRIIHCIINSYNNPRLTLNINVYFFYIEDFLVLHMEAKQTGSYTMGGSADLIRYIIKNDFCFPSAIISYGICFGNDYLKQNLGDTIIVNRLYPYFMSAKIEEKYFFVKDSNIFSIDTNLDTKIQHLLGKGYLNKDKVFYGNMVTGEAVISNKIMKQIFINAATNQPILGGEMEGYGLFKECQGYECSIPCLIVKSICDWGSYKNCVKKNIKDKLQAYASDQAYKILSLLLKEEANVVKISMYEQIKKYIPTLAEGKVISETMLKEILDKDIKTYKSNKNLDLLCSLIINQLKNEKIIESTENTKVYRIKKG